ncbi:MAG: GNAT family N-acetyltransferase [Candidatus Krumholzibacteriia bacterium]
MSELLISTPEMQGRLCQNLQDPPLGRLSWNKLLQHSETRSVFLTWQWLVTWWECFREGSELYTFAVLHHGSLVGIAPLMLRRQDGLRVVEFLGMGSSDYCDFIAPEENKPEVIGTVFESLLRRRDRWDRIRLRYLPERSSTARILGTLERPAGLELHTQVESVCPALLIEASRPFAESCTRKKSLVRHARYFERLSPLEFRHALDADEIADLLPQFFEQHRDRRFMAGDRSLFDDARHRRFYERMVLELLDCGWLRFSVLCWRGEVLAFHLGFMYDGIFTWYKPTLNVDYARYSPGEVLLKKLLEDAIASGAREFDFTVGDEAFKERFANVKRNNLRVEIIQESRRSLGTRALEIAQRHVKQRHPALYGHIKSALHFLKRSQNGHPMDADATPRPAVLFPLPRMGIVRRCLWRTTPLPPVPSEFRAQWARYSQIKAISRREGLKPEFLITSLARLRRGESVVVALWQERPVALLWLARDASRILAAAGFEDELPEGAALITDSYLAADVEVSPRRETLMPTLQTFLAAEGVSSLYGIDDTRAGASLPARCGAELEPVALYTDVGLLFWHWRRHQRIEQKPSRGGT